MPWKFLLFDKSGDALLFSCTYLLKIPGTSLVVQWLRLHPPKQGLIPGQGAKILHASWPKHKIEICYNKFNKDFKNGSLQKNL